MLRMESPRRRTRVRDLDVGEAVEVSVGAFAAILTRLASGGVRVTFLGFYKGLPATDLDKRPDEALVDAAWRALNRHARA